MLLLLHEAYRNKNSAYLSGHKKIKREGKKRTEKREREEKQKFPFRTRPVQWGRPRLPRSRVQRPGGRSTDGPQIVNVPPAASSQRPGGK